IAVPAPDAIRPFPQLRLAVVPAASAHTVMEAHVTPRRSSLLGSVHHDKSDIPFAQQRVDVVHEPARVPELECVPSLWQRRERRPESHVVARKVRRQLPQERPALSTERLDALEETGEPVADVTQSPDVREVARHLDREGKAVGHGALPRRNGVDLRQPVEGVVHLDGVEEAGVVLEPGVRGPPLVERLLPARVVPAGAAYADSASAIWRHRSCVPAAAMRERRSRSSSAAPNGRGSSKSATGRPTSRQSSWPAAMSTERASFSEHTPSTRPAARWQSESASDPITRRRWATPENAAACSATSDVSVASNMRISICSFGRKAPSGCPSSHAPSPRRAVHSSPEPKSYT